MRATLPEILWRFLLALALVASPLAPPAASAGNHVEVAATDSSMPSHGDPIPAPMPADEVPCEDQCCPQPQCDPTHCRIAVPLPMSVVRTGPLPLPMFDVLPPATPELLAPPGERLRPPIG